MPRPSCFFALVVGFSALVRAAEFPAPFNSGDAPHRAAPALTAREAVAALRLPSGMRATLFAGEPDVQNPIAMAWDARGRLWIAENYTYAEREVRFDARLRDRMLVFEEGDDGRFRSRRVFIDSVQRLTSVEVGHGGVWLMCPPRLLFVPDANGDAVPDAAPQVVLDGFTPPDANHHNFANGLRFGPDGWLYGRCGASSPGELGTPGTPAAERIPLRGTMWRYHPVRKTVEVLTSGTTNPWGHDWDAHGELFYINTVNGHLWHGIAGAHFVRAHTIDPNPRVYALIDQHADHWHFDTAKTWQQSRDGAANAQGGGHAHAGMMIYQGDNWPAQYRGGLLTLNFHGRRANHELLERRGSGYVGKHGADVFVSDDPWFRGIDLGYGPDGGVFVLDWSDTGECHNSTGVSRTSGRIYKIVHGEPKRNGPADLTDVSGRELAALQTHRNAWFARQARLELATRAAAGHKLTHASEDLREMFAREADPVVKLRALWTLHAIGAANRDFLRAQLKHADEHVRTWAIRLLTDDWPLDTLMSQRPVRPERADPALVADFVALARNDPSGLVRLALASVLQRLSPALRVELAAALAARAEDASDHNLPLLLWYGLIPVADVAPRELVDVALGCEWPMTRRFIARRLAEDMEKQPAAVDALLAAAATKSLAFQSDIIRGLSDALTGWRRAPKPAAWDGLAAKVGSMDDASLRERVRDLNVLFGDGRALADVTALALDGKADLAARKAALRALIEARPPELREICEQLVRVRFLNSVAVRGLVLFDDPKLGELIVSAYGRYFHPSERDAAIEALLARPAFARVLLDQIAAGKIPRAVITPYRARQIRSFGDAALTRKLAEVWGEVRETSADKHALIARLKTELTPAALASADKRAGRVTFNQLCAACHKLYGEGTSLGPDLTGAGRDNLDYLLENIVDPSGVVTADYRMTVVKLKDGRTVNGFISVRTPQTVTLRSVSESQTIARPEIESIEESAQSVMPEGLLETLTPEQRRDLVAYLMHTAQVPLP